MIKRLILALALLFLGHLEAPAQFTFVTNYDNTLAVTGYSGPPWAITIPTNASGLPVTSIAPNAFNPSDLTSVTIPSTITNIGDGAFGNCESLTNIIVDPQNINYSSSNGVLFNKNLTTLVAFPNGQGGSYIIPNSVTSIGNDAFFECSLLTNVTLPNGVTNIGIYGLAQCPGLTSVVIPAGVTAISDAAFFYDTGLTNETIPNAVNNIGDDAFAGCSSLNHINFGTGVTNIGSGAFGSTGLLAVTIPSNIVSIGDRAFSACYNLTVISVAAQNPGYSSSNGVLFSKDLSILIQYPIGLKGTYAIPAGVTSLADGAFSYCSNLTSITIPAAITNIGAEAFANCTGLTAIAVDPRNLFYSSVAGVLFDKNQVTLVQYPIALGGNYVIPTSVSSIGDEAFSSSTNLTSVTMSGGLTNISDGAFANCSGLTNVTIGDNVANVGGDAFYGCTSLTALTIPGSVKSMGYQAFLGCASLNRLTISDGVPYIGANAFYNCGSLFIATIPASVTNIADGAFVYCYNLSLLYFLGNAPVADSSAFFDNSGTVAFYLPGTTGWTTNFAGLPAVPGSATTASLQVNIGPDGASAAGAQWQVDGGTLQNSGAVVPFLAPGNHLVTFAPAPGWAPPGNVFVQTPIGLTTTNAIYTPSIAEMDGLILVTNGFGTIHAPRNLTLGKKYTVAATAKPGNRFVLWLGGTNQPYAVLGTNSSLSFTNEPGLLLEANFITNEFMASAGAYYGLFAPADVNREQTNSGILNFSLTKSGVLSGDLRIGTRIVPLTGKFDSYGNAAITSKWEPEINLNTTLQLNFATQSLAGKVSDGSFTAQLMGFRDDFSASAKAAAYEGRYTLNIFSANDPSVGVPFGYSYGTVKVSPSGHIIFTGSLADGTPVTQSTVLSKDGFWPFYASLYGGKGSIWCWNYISTNGSITSSGNASWINATNTSKAAAYRSGFTNQSALVLGTIYETTAEPIFAMTNGLVFLVGGGLPFVISNQITLGAHNRITVKNSVENTNNLSLTIDKTTAVVTGSFRNPSNPAKTIKVNGVLVQEQGTAYGYFLGANTSGQMALVPQQ